MAPMFNRRAFVDSACLRNGLAQIDRSQFDIRNLRAFADVVRHGNATELNGPVRFTIKALDANTDMRSQGENWLRGRGRFNRVNIDIYCELKESIVVRTGGFGCANL